MTDSDISDPSGKKPVARAGSEAAFCKHTSFVEIRRDVQWHRTFVSACLVKEGKERFVGFLSLFAILPSSRDRGLATHALEGTQRWR